VPLERHAFGVRPALGRARSFGHGVLPVGDAVRAREAAATAPNVDDLAHGPRLPGHHGASRILLEQALFGERLAVAGLVGAGDRVPAKHAIRAAARAQDARWICGGGGGGGG